MVLTKDYADTETGEIRNGIIVSEQEYRNGVEAQKEIKRRNQQHKYFESKNKRDSAIDIFRRGNDFYFSNYKELVNVLDGDTALGFRFLYLCTYANGQGYLKLDRNTYMKESDFSSVFKLAKTALFELKNKLYDKGLIKKIDYRIMINSKYFLKKNKLKTSFLGNSTRVMEEGIRELYNKSLPKEHKFLGIVIPLLQYLNINTNDICKNTDEINKEYMQMLTITEICKVIGYDPTHCKRLHKKLIDTTVGGEPLLKGNETNQGKWYTMNPLIFYKGSDVEYIKILAGDFNIKN